MLNKKGFTLFTALISLILVSIALALVFNMIATEETYIDLINEQSSMSDLITMGDLAKADAFNSFLIILRSKWEEHKSNEQHPLILTREHMEMDWNSFVDTFVKVEFFERNFAAFFAEQLSHHLRYTHNPPGYSIEIKQAADTQSDTFNAIIEQIFIDGGQKVDVVDCAQGSNECVGSFYLTLDTTRLSDSNYELLPIITVLRYKNNQVIQRPILNRQVYKIYIPWRGFQAIRVVRRIAIGPEAEKKDVPIRSQNYTGIFSPKIHNTLEQARLGFCDPGYCFPRNNFFATPSQYGTNQNKCKDIPDQTVSNQIPSYLNGGYDLPRDFGTYNPIAVRSQNLKTNFEELYELTVAANIPNNVTYENSLLLLTGSIVYNDINISDINVEVGTKRSKQVIDRTGLVVDVMTDQVSPITFSELKDISGIAGGLGLFFNSDNNKSVKPINQLPNWFTAEGGVNLVTDVAAAGIDMKCAELESTEILFVFEENDPRHYVRPSYLTGSVESKVKVSIELTDYYTEFVFQPRNNWQGLSTTNGFIFGEPNDTFDTNQWICYSVITSDVSVCGAKGSE